MRVPGVREGEVQRELQGVLQEDWEGRGIMELLGFILMASGVIVAFLAGVFFMEEGAALVAFLIIASFVLHFLSAAVFAAWYADETANMNTCPVCHEAYDAEYKYCPIDGAEIEVDVE